MAMKNVVVLMKQVPDVRIAGEDVLLPDGSINRAILPAIVNPNDFYALQQALLIKDKYPQVTVTVMSMGPMQAEEVVREGLFRGVDTGVLLCDKQFAGSDTLATSYVLAQGIKKLGSVDLVLCGCQTIDGDTAHIAPQVANHLDWPQLTSVVAMEINDGKVIANRQLENGIQRAQVAYPAVVSISNQADVCRPRNAKRVMAYKDAAVTTWTLQDIQADERRCGSLGSPTRVSGMKTIAWQVKETKHIEPTQESIAELMTWIIK